LSAPILHQHIQTSQSFQIDSQQLVRVALEPEPQLIPEISGNRLVLAIRLLRLGEDTRLHASGQDATLEITLCA
jgi:cell division protein ZapD